MVSNVFKTSEILYVPSTFSNKRTLFRHILFSTRPCYPLIPYHYLLQSPLPPPLSRPLPYPPSHLIPTRRPTPAPFHLSRSPRPSPPLRPNTPNPPASTIDIQNTSTPISNPSYIPQCSFRKNQNSVT